LTESVGEEVHFDFCGRWKMQQTCIREGIEIGSVGKVNDCFKKVNKNEWIKKLHL